MIINIRTVSWNGNIIRRFYESVEEFVEKRPNEVNEIRENKAIIGQSHIEVGDLRTEKIITFQKEEDTLIFLKEIKGKKQS